MYDICVYTYIEEKGTTKWKNETIPDYEVSC